MQQKMIPLTPNAKIIKWFPQLSRFISCGQFIRESRTIQRVATEICKNLSTHTIQETIVIGRWWQSGKANKKPPIDIIYSSIREHFREAARTSSQQFAALL